METLVSSPVLVCRSSKNLSASERSSSTNSKIPNIIRRNRSTLLIASRKVPARIPAITDVSAITDTSQVEVTWQIVVGAIAGVTPFVVAGIEFGKRIVAQRRCQVCEGSGLVVRDEDYFRCPSCGGFLPWQSWKRFFSADYTFKMKQHLYSFTCVGLSYLLEGKVFDTVLALTFDWPPEIPLAVSFNNSVDEPLDIYQAGKKWSA